jgi:uncharacterized membrane protein
VIDAVATPAATSIRVTPKIGIVALVLGVLSVALLGASFVWAHTGVRSRTPFVVAWVLATVGALVFSIRFYFLEKVWPTHISRQLAGWPGGRADLGRRAACVGLPVGRGDQPHRRLWRRLIVPASLAERWASNDVCRGKTSTCSSTWSRCWSCS